jgi:hypothetical protein
MIFFAMALLLFAAANVMVDYVFAMLRNSGFYIAESLLFSSYWVLFIPFIALLSPVFKSTQKWQLHCLTAGMAMGLHLLIYPAMVWIVSRVFFDHTFPYVQTFSYGLTAYGLQTIILYTAAMLIYKSFGTPSFTKPPTFENTANHPVIEEANVHTDFVHSILVTTQQNQKEILLVKDVIYFMARSPYIQIHHKSKTYLQAETLKSLESQLNHHHFVRIHKGCIVNLHFVASICSRNNGDYDITLTNGNSLRVSRSYAKTFRSKWTAHHQHSR